MGALATQALVNPHYGLAGLDLLAQHSDPARVIEALIAAIRGATCASCTSWIAQGRVAAYTGTQCVDWCGHVAVDDFSVAGNMLAGARVVEDTADAYRDHPQLGFAERLLAAMEAGEAAGGDKRGKQAAALRIVTTESYPVLDLRVDDHADPLTELRRLHDKSLERFQPFVACLPSRADPAASPTAR